MTEKETLSKKVEIVYKALQKKSRWYTGLSIKKYLQQEIFNLQPDFKNHSILAGRWSAYCHYSEIPAFNNLLDKNHINFDSRVIVHPLLPDYLVAELLKKTKNITSLDIEKSTLSINPDLILKKAQEENIDAVILYGFNGLYGNISKTAKLLKPLTIPTIFVVDNFDINSSLLEAFESIELGSVLWSFGDSFWDDQLDTVMEYKLKTHTWFTSWHIETRTLSLLEYHLSESHQLYIQVIEAFLYLLQSKVSNGLGQKIKQLATNKFYLSSEFSSPSEAQQLISAKYNKMFYSAVPDLVFDLQLETPVNYIDYGHAEQVLQSSSEIQIQSKNLYDYFIKQLPIRPKNSLEIPDYLLGQAYLKYTILTTEANHWYQLLSQKGTIIETFPPLHPIFADDKNLVNSQAVVNYGLMIDVISTFRPRLQ